MVLFCTRSSLVAHNSKNNMFEEETTEVEEKVVEETTEATPEVV